MKRATPVLAIALLGGCNLFSGKGDTAEEALPEAARPATGQAANPIEIEQGLGTPNAERVATLGLLNKRNNITQEITLKSGELQRLGNVIIKVESCERSLPWEQDQEEGAFVQVFVNERAAPGEDVAWRTVFSGWLFRNSPSLNVVEHPIYDVWVKNCAMSFPGEEAPVEGDEPASKAANPSGSASGASPAA